MNTDRSTAEARIDAYTKILNEAITHNLPVPQAISGRDGILGVRFDSAEDVEKWAANTDFWSLHAREHVYQPEWQDKPIRSLHADAQWRGWALQVDGWTTVEDGA